jgi:hypothetical protein
MSTFASFGFALLLVVSLIVAVVDNTVGRPRTPSHEIERSRTAARSTTSPRTYSYPLSISRDGRSLIDQTGQPFFINGDTAWSLIAQLTRENADLYLRDRQQKGFNAVLINLLEHRFASRAPANIYGDAPFTAGGTFTAPNEAYFLHADWVIRAAAEKGLVVLLAPLYLGYECGNQGWCAEVRSSSVATMRAWGHYVGTRYKSFPNIIWVIGGDTDSIAAGVGPQVREFVAGIRDVDTTHVMTAHNDAEQSARALWSDDWLALDSIYTYQATAPKALAEYARSPFMPVFLLESAYEHEHKSTPQSLRNQAYGAILSGATLGHVFGNCPVWGFGTTAGFCAATTTDWQRELNSEGARTISLVGKVLMSRHFAQLQPDTTHTVMTAGYQSGRTYATTARTADGASIIAYIPTRRTVTLNLTQLAGSLARAWWVNPSTAQATLIGDFPTSGSQAFTTPSSSDWLLIVDNGDLNLPAPGN